MMVYHNLTVVGTSHISPESIRMVQKVIRDTRPEVVAVELDRSRFDALLRKKRQRLRWKDVRRFGVVGFLFALFGSWIEERLGKIVGTKPGDEMRAAIAEAAKVHAKLLLIDQDIAVTISRLLKQLTLREKCRFAWDLVFGIFRKGAMAKIDLRKVPEEELIEKVIAHVRDRYPTVYRVLIEERDKIMARKLREYIARHPTVKIVAVVGAGHQKAIERYLTSS